MQQPKTCLLSLAEYSIDDDNVETFDAENISGNPEISDMGSGLYIKEGTRFVLAGIMSREQSNDVFPVGSPIKSHVFRFTNIPSYVSWIESLSRT